MLELPEVWNMYLGNHSHWVELVLKGGPTCAGSQAEKAGCWHLSGFTSWQCVLPMVKMRDLVPALLDFSLSWVLSLLTVLLLLHLIMGVFTPRCCALEVYTFLFDFCGGSKWRFRRDCALLNRVETGAFVKVRPNAFCLMRWPCTFGDWRQNIVVWLWNQTHILGACFPTGGTILRDCQSSEVMSSLQT